MEFANYATDHEQFPLFPADILSVSLPPESSVPDQGQVPVICHHPGGSPKPEQDDPFSLGVVTKVKASFDENQSSRIFYKRVTGMKN